MIPDFLFLCVRMFVTQMFQIIKHILILFKVNQIQYLISREKKTVQALMAMCEKVIDP